MALRSGYKGFKKPLAPLKIIRPGTLGIDNDVLISELNKVFFQRSEEIILGARNIFDPELETSTITGITVTRNSNKTYTCNGTATSNCYFRLFYTESEEEYKKLLTPGDEYIISGCPEGGGNNTYELRIEMNSQTVIGTTDYGNGGKFVAPEFNTRFAIYLIVRSGVSLSNKVFKPMIRLATDPITDFSENVMTNKELSDSIQNVDDRISLIECDKTAAGTYTLSATVDAQGKVTYVWTAVTP